MWWVRGAQNPRGQESLGVANRRERRRFTRSGARRFLICRFATTRRSTDTRHALPRSEKVEIALRLARDEGIEHGELLPTLFENDPQPFGGARAIAPSLRAAGQSLHNVVDRIPQIVDEGGRAAQGDEDVAVFLGDGGHCGRVVEELGDSRFATRHLECGERRDVVSFQPRDASDLRHVIDDQSAALGCLDAREALGHERRAGLSLHV